VASDDQRNLSALTFRGVTVEASAETWEEDPRYVRVVLSVRPLPVGLDEIETYVVHVKAPEAQS
jgi:hypothetical protein